MKRVITIILAMAMALSICSVAYAENGNDSKPTITIILLQQARITVFFRRTQAPSI